LHETSRPQVDGAGELSLDVAMLAYLAEPLRQNFNRAMREK
jgi:hypothetical protein